MDEEPIPSEDGKPEISKVSNKHFKINSQDLAHSNPRNRSKIKSGENDYELDLKNTMMSFVTAEGNQERDMTINVKTKPRDQIEESKVFDELDEEIPQSLDEHDMQLDFDNQSCSENYHQIGLKEEY